MEKDNFFKSKNEAVLFCRFVNEVRSFLIFVLVFITMVNDDSLNTTDPLRPFIEKIHFSVGKPLDQKNLRSETISNFSRKKKHLRQHS